MPRGSDRGVVALVGGASNLGAPSGEEGEEPMSRTPWLVVALLAVACGGSPVSPVPVTRVATTGGGGATGSPTSSGPTPTPGELVLSGLISGTTLQGPQPLGGANVNALVTETHRDLAYSYWWAHGPTSGDSAGHFELTGLASSTTVQVQVWRDGYVQQCASPRITMQSDMKLDVELVSRESLSASPDSVPPPAAGYRIHLGPASPAAGRRGAAGRRCVRRLRTHDGFPSSDDVQRCCRPLPALRYSGRGSGQSVRHRRRVRVGSCRAKHRRHRPSDGW